MPNQYITVRYEHQWDSNKKGSTQLKKSSQSIHAWKYAVMSSLCLNNLTLVVSKKSYPKCNSYCDCFGCMYLSILFVLHYSFLKQNFILQISLI